MKKMFLVLVSVMFIGSLCFAAEAQKAPYAKPVQKQAEAKTITGKVESIVFSNPAKKTRGAIVVVDDKGQKINLIVRTGADILDKNGKASSLAKMTKDSKVTVAYAVDPKTGNNKVKSIRVIE